MPRFNYEPNLITNIYNADNFTFQEQLRFYQGDRFMKVIPQEWADG